MSVRIIVDSTADINPAIADRFTVVPLTIHFGEKEYIDGVTITHREFYTKLVESSDLPSTSQATPVAFARLFEEIVSAGDSAVVLTIASKLSGTCQSANIAASEYPGQIFVVDTENVAIGAGILAELALTLANEGLSAQKIAERITEERKNVLIIALLDTLEYLKRGGRISKTVAFAGGILSIKPLIQVAHGEIDMLGKARGTKNGNALMTAEIQKCGGIDFDKPFLLGYTGLSDELLKKYMADSESLWPNGSASLPVAEIGSVVGTHAGPGAFAAAFFKK